MVFSPSQSTTCTSSALSPEERAVRLLGALIVVLGVALLAFVA
ncbi:hypothetical protein [Natrinema sp. 1APR25-10V2]|nr:hypothetical protein [Natrinema sp. 1APR25-10V2]